VSACVCVCMCVCFPGRQQVWPLSPAPDPTHLSRELPGCRCLATPSLSPRRLLMTESQGLLFSQPVNTHQCECSQWEQHREGNTAKTCCMKKKKLFIKSCPSAFSFPLRNNEPLAVKSTVMYCVCEQ